MVSIIILYYNLMGPPLYTQSTIDQNVVMQHTIVQFYKSMGCYMSLKVHFLDCYLEFFPENPEAVNEHIQQFRQNISTMAKWYQAKWSPSMLADDFWTFRRDDPQTKYSRKSSTITFQVIYCKYGVFSNFKCGSIKNLGL